MKSLTSASRLIKEYEFSARQFKIDQMANAGDYLLTKDETDLDNNEKEAFNAAKARLDGQDVEGSLFVKAEWEGYGEAMPPARSETLF